MSLKKKQPETTSLASLEDHLRERFGFSAQAWLALRQKLSLKTYARKEFFLEAGQVCQKLGFITQGYVRLFFLTEEREITKDFGMEGDFCGSYASLLNQVPSRFYVQAMEPLQLWTINRSDLFALYEQEPELNRMGRLQMEQMFIRKENREAAFLLDTPATRFETLRTEHPDWLQRIPQKYLAAYLGMREETLSRLRKQQQ